MALGDQPRQAIGVLLLQQLDGVRPLVRGLPGFKTGINARNLQRRTAPSFPHSSQIDAVVNRH